MRIKSYLIVGFALFGHKAFVVNNCCKSHSGLIQAADRPQVVYVFLSIFWRELHRTNEVHLC